MAKLPSGSFKINNTVIPTPTNYEASIEDLSSAETGRTTLDGKMHKYVVAVKATYKCDWSHLSWEDAASIYNAIDGKNKVNFTHLDIRVPNQWVTGEYYVGQHGGTALDLSQSDTRRNWTNLSLTFIEI